MDEEDSVYFSRVFTFSGVSTTRVQVGGGGPFFFFLLFILPVKLNIGDVIKSVN